MRSAVLHLLLAASLSLPWGGAARAQPAPDARESSVKAAFLFKFASFVEWPAGTLQKPGEPLVIAVSGDEDVAAELDQLAAARTVDGHPVQVRRIAESAVAAGAHIVFFGGRRESKLRESVAAVPPPTLVVTEQPGGLQAGAALNFSSEGGRVRFSASVAAAEARGVRLSARLLAVAQSIEGVRR